MAAAKHGNSWATYLEIGTLLRLGWPNSLSQILNFLPGMVMMHFLGTDPLDLAAAGMGFMFVNVAGQMVIVSTGNCSGTFISQAFGAGNFVRCGEVLQRQLMMHVFVVLIVSPGWLWCEQLLVAFGQPGAIAARTAQFVRWRMAALPCLAITRDFQWYLLAQRIMQFPMVIGVASNLLSIVGFVVLIPRFGFIGAPLAITLANALQAACLVSLSYRYLPEQDAWPRWSLSTALSGWREMVVMALPAGALQLGEWLAWECNLFFSGRLCSNSQMCTELAVFPIVSNTMVILFQVHNGCNLAAGSLVGIALGSGDAAKAVRIGRQDMVLVAMLSGMLAAGLYLLRDDWGRFFTDSDAITELTAQVLPWVAMYVFIDSLGPGALVNILRNAGVVRVPAVITFVAFYLIGIPFGLSLTFPGHGASWGLVGLWVGLVLGLYLQVFSLLVLFHCLDWQQLAEDAKARSSAAGPTELPSSSTPAANKSSKRRAYEKLGLEANNAPGDDSGEDANVPDIVLGKSSPIS